MSRRRDALARFAATGQSPAVTLGSALRQQQRSTSRRAPSLLVLTPQHVARRVTAELVAHHLGTECACASRASWSHGLTSQAVGSWLLQSADISGSGGGATIETVIAASAGNVSPT